MVTLGLVNSWRFRSGSALPSWHFWCQISEIWSQMPLPALKFLFGPLALFDLFPRKTVSLLDLGFTTLGPVWWIIFFLILLWLIGLQVFTLFLYLLLSLWHNRGNQTTPFSKQSVTRLKTTEKNFPKKIQKQIKGDFYCLEVYIKIMTIKIGSRYSISQWTSRKSRLTINFFAPSVGKWFNFYLKKR